MLKGDPKPKTAIPWKTNGWNLSSALPVSAGVADHVTELLGLVYPRAKNLQQLGRMNITLSVAIYAAGDERPAAFLEPEFVSKLADLRAAIDFDLYWIPD
jgi:hypothetical protein